MVTVPTKRQSSSQKQLKGGKIYFGSWFVGIESIVAEKAQGRLRGGQGVGQGLPFSSQPTATGGEEETGRKDPHTPYSLAPVKLHLLMVLQFPQHLGS